MPRVRSIEGKTVLDRISERKLPHCGKCPDLMCERFTRFKDPDMSDAEAAACLTAMEQELQARE